MNKSNRLQLEQSPYPTVTNPTPEKQKKQPKLSNNSNSLLRKSLVRKMINYCDTLQKGRSSSRNYPKGK